MESVRVVRISSGIPQTVYTNDGRRIWHPSHLTKNGVPDARRYADGWLADPERPITESLFVIYDEKREIKARKLRDEIAQLQTALSAARKRLLEYYANTITSERE